MSDNIRAKIQELENEVRGSTSASILPVVCLSSRAPLVLIA